jgi:UDP-N-acetylglucosamine--N-acetylmuramyl-(pentapeptide) pyrophosphoryl-undecaprenol N-acetylglucosamine transferase
MTPLQKKQKIAITGGGTGGHVFPAMAIAENLKQQNNKIILLWIGEKNSFEEQACKNSDISISFFPILAGKLRRYFSFKNIIDIPKFCIGIIQSLFILKRNKIEVLFSKGGYAALGPVLAAYFLRIPVIIHDSDSIPGLTTKISAYFAKHICLSFPDAKKIFSKKLWPKIHITGLPIRSHILQWKNKNIKAKKEVQKKHFPLLEKNRPVIVIIGGSQGAQAINKAISSYLTEILSEFCVIHITGKGKTLQKILPKKIQKYYQTFEFIENPQDIGMFYAAADLIIMRSSSAIMEVQPFKKKLILIPLPSAASNHQQINAEQFIHHYSQSSIIKQDNNNFSYNLYKKILKYSYEIKDKKPIKDKNTSFHNTENIITQYILFPDIKMT